MFLPKIGDARASPAPSLPPTLRHPIIFTHYSTISPMSANFFIADGHMDNGTKIIEKKFEQMFLENWVVLKCW